MAAHATTHTHFARHTSSIRFQSSFLQKQSSNTSTYIHSTRLKCLPKQLQRNLPPPPKPLQPHKHTLPKLPCLARPRKRLLSLPKRKNASLARKLGLLTFTKVTPHYPWRSSVFSCLLWIL